MTFLIKTMSALYRLINYGDFNDIRIMAKYHDPAPIIIEAINQKKDVLARDIIRDDMSNATLPLANAFVHALKNCDILMVRWMYYRGLYCNQLELQYHTHGINILIDTIHNIPSYLLNLKWIVTNTKNHVDYHRLMHDIMIEALVYRDATLLDIISKKYCYLYNHDSERLFTVQKYLKKLGDDVPIIMYEKLLLHKVPIEDFETILVDTTDSDVIDLIVRSNVIKDYKHLFAFSCNIELNKFAQLVNLELYSTNLLSILITYIHEGYPSQEVLAPLLNILLSNNTASSIDINDIDVHYSIDKRAILRIPWVKDIVDKYDGPKTKRCK